MRALQIPDRGGRMHFQEVLYALCARSGGVELPPCALQDGVETPTPTLALALTPTLTPSRSEGPSGFYRGFSAHYVRVRPHARHAALAWAWG